MNNAEELALYIKISSMLVHSSLECAVLIQCRKISIRLRCLAETVIIGVSVLRQYSVCIFSTSDLDRDFLFPWISSKTYDYSSFLFLSPFLTASHIKCLR